MFNGLHAMHPTDAELATQALAEEGKYRFPSFSASDAVTLVILPLYFFNECSPHIFSITRDYP